MAVVVIWEFELIYRPPTFVSKSDVVPDESLKGVEEDVDIPVEEEEEEEESDDSDSSRSAPPSPRMRDEEGEGDDRPSAPGLGGARSRPRGFGPPDEPEDAPKAKIGGRGGIGFSSRGGGGRGGIGSASRSSAAVPSFAAETSQPGSGSSTPRGGLGSGNAPPKSMAGTSTPTTTNDAPSVFGRTLPSAAESSSSTTSAAPRAQRSFATRASAPAPSTPTPLTSVEAAHFRKIENDYGAKLLSKLGWAPGKGLGLNEDGRAVPVAAGKVLRGQGITSGVRTEDSKREARRKGEIVSDSEDEEEERRKARGRSGKGKGKAPGQKQEQGEPSWKKSRKVKVKVEHKTYEQIVAEASDQAASGVGLVLDARSGEVS